MLLILVRKEHVWAANPSEEEGEMPDGELSSLDANVATSFPECSEMVLEFSGAAGAAELESHLSPHFRGRFARFHEPCPQQIL